MISIIKKIKFFYSSLKGLISKKITMMRFSNCSLIKEAAYGDFIIRGYRAEDYKQILSIYNELNKAKFSFYHAGLYEKIGNKLMFVAVREDKIVGMDMFYMNLRDFKENTVHEGFIGVLPEAERQGIATQMRQAAIKHFCEAGLDGISSRISKNNVASLRSAEKLGFKVCEEYFDEAMQEERYYLIANFK